MRAFVLFSFLCVSLARSDVSLGYLPSSQPQNGNGLAVPALQLPGLQSLNVVPSGGQPPQSQPAYLPPSAGPKYLPVQKEPIVTVQKHIYVHVPPQEQELPVREQPAPEIQKHYKIIFIKAPVTPQQLPVLPPQVQHEEKTLIYVLANKPDNLGDLVIPTPPPLLPSKPEVFYINYKEKKEELGYHYGVDSVQALPDEPQKEAASRQLPKQLSKAYIPLPASLT